MIIELYTKQGDLFDNLHTYLQAFENSCLEPHLQYLAALLMEHRKKDPIAALPYYLDLAEHSPDALHCLKKAESLVKAATDPFAMPHFLERLDRKLLVKLAEGVDPDLKRWLLHKDGFEWLLKAV